MKQFWQEVGLAVVLGLMMPGLILNIMTYSAHRHVSEVRPDHVTTPAVINETIIKIQTDNGSVVPMELESYLTGVVLAEMPASFETEALKAQAVVARTYTLRAHGGKGKHEDAAVCMESSCCQAYRSVEDYLLAGGSRENVEKVRDAVAATAGNVLTYQGQLIEATYFSCSGGSTEDAVAVWGTDVPYLQSVASPGEEHATHFTDEVSFTVMQLNEKLNLSVAEETFSISDVTNTAGGGVATITICGTEFEGTDLRKLLGLSSTAFTVTIQDDVVTFHTKGFGHRVGMSQYGADAMAASGSNYEEILLHYYQGAVLEKRSD